MTTPPYYGLRATWWRDERWGASIDFTHAKIHATEATRVASGFSRLSFTHGLNTLTVSVLRRFPTGARATPYLGAGLGIAIPHVEIDPPADFPETLEYQFGGPAIQVRAGVDHALTERWSVFGEAMATHVRLRAEMEGGGDLATDVTTRALNLGVTYRF